MNNEELIQHPDFIYYMPNFDFSYFKIRNFFLSIKSIKLKKKYIQFLKAQVTDLHKQYVIGPAYYPSMGKEYLETIFRPEKLIFPNRNKVSNYQIFRQLSSMEHLAQSWYEVQIEYRLTDAEMQDLSISQKMDFRSDEQKQDNINPLEEILNWPFWENKNDPGLIQALDAVLSKHAQFKNGGMNFNISLGTRNINELNKQALGYLLKTLYSYIPISEIMQKLCETKFRMNGEEINYYQITKNIDNIRDIRREYINNLFIVDNENHKMK